jgi:predicted hydrocarbon binding protein
VRLPKLLIENLEIFQDFQMQVNENNVSVKFVDSTYSELCAKLGTSNICSTLGCPICSAIACILAGVSGKPVVFEGDAYSPDGKTIESSYKILAG